MKKSLISLLFLVGIASGQYKAEPSGPPPSELAPSVTSALNKQGTKVVDPNGSVYCEIWFRNGVPSGPKSSEEGVALPTIPFDSFLGVIRFTKQAADRRGQSIKPGLYTLRYSLHPVNGDHLGVAPQRDFLVLTLPTEDKDPKLNPTFDQLMAMSRKVSGTAHPAVLSMSSSTCTKGDIEKEGDHDWVLHTSIGKLPVAVILIGKAEG